MRLKVKDTSNKLLFFKSENTSSDVGWDSKTNIIVEIVTIEQAEEFIRNIQCAISCARETDMESQKELRKRKLAQLDDLKRQVEMLENELKQ